MFFVDMIRVIRSRLRSKIGIPNHLLWAISNDGYTKLRAHILAPGELHVSNHVPTFNQSTA